MYPGRILLPMDEASARDRLTAWRTAPLVQAPLTEPAPCPRARDLVMIEDMDEVAVPCSVEPEAHFSQVEKHAQIGVHAADLLLRGFLDSFIMPAGGRGAVLVVDLSTRTGDFAKAFLKIKTPTPLYYLGFAENDLGREWVENHVLVAAQEAILEGKLRVGDGELPPAEMPAALLAEAPPRPDLNVLVWAPEPAPGVPVLRAPESVLQWRDHQRLGAPLAELLDEAVRAGALEGRAPPGAGEAGGGAEGAPQATADDKEPPAKRLRVDRGDIEVQVQAGPVTKLKRSSRQLGEGLEVVLMIFACASLGVGAWSSGAADIFPGPGQVVDPATIPGPLLHEVPLTKAASLKLVLTVGHRIFLKNEEDQDVTLEPGTFLAGYYKGKWWHQQRVEDPVLDQDVPFHLEDSRDPVIFNGQYQRVGALILRSREETGPASAQVCYHSLVDEPVEGDPTHFKLETKHKLYFRVADLPAKSNVKTEGPGDSPAKVVLLNHLAGVCPAQVWETRITHVAWVMKWVPCKGYQPVRPQVVCKHRVTVPAARAVELST